MKPINQTQDFCVCLHGYTLPKYSLYGNVYGVTWYTDDIRTRKKHGKNVYIIHVFCPAADSTKKGSWQKTDTLSCQNGSAIYVRIRDFIASDAYIDKTPVKCEHKQKIAKQAENAIKALERKDAIIAEKQRKEDLQGAPYLRKVNNNFTPDNRTYYELAVKLGKNVNDFPFCGDGEMRHDTRDRMIMSFKDYRPEDERPMVAGYAPKSGTLQNARIDRILSGDKEELIYYLCNTQKVDKRVIEYTAKEYGIPCSADIQKNKDYVRIWLR